MKKEVPLISIDELIETLKRSELPTVITEGKDDYKYYRRIEEALSRFSVSLFPVGGRGRVLEIFERRKELGRNNVIFLVDLDLWIFNEIPHEYKHRKLISTNGYSIENDLYCDGLIEDFLYERESRLHGIELSNLLKWYSFAIGNLLAGRVASISEHPNKILNENGDLNKEYMEEIGYDSPNQELFSLVLSDYKRLLRGKNLINLAVRHLNAPRRDTKFNKSQIMEIGAARRGNNLQRISKEISDLFAAN